MASIPLPALHTAPITPPVNPLQEYAQMMGIKNEQQEMAQRQAMAPLQQQEGQQQVQSGQLELQQQQQQLKDQQSFRAAMQDPENRGKTMGDIADTLANQGAISMQGWQQMKKADIDQRTALATLDEKGLANAAAAHKQTQDLYNNVMDMPDEQLAANWPQIAQQYDAIPGNMRAPLNPQQPMTKQQLQQFGPMLAMHGAYLDEALKRQQEQADLTKTQTDNQVQQQMLQNGGNQQLADARYRSLLAAQNQGQQPSAGDAAWMKAYKEQKEMVPAFNFNLQQQAAAGAAGAPGNQQPGGGTDWGKVAQKYGMTPGAFDQTAEKYFSTGVLPPIGRSMNAIAMNRDLMNRAAELHPNASLAANSAEFKANSDSLKKLQTNFDQVQAFEQTAEANMNLLQRTAQKIPDLGTRFGNIPVRMINAQMIGTDNMAAFKTALTTAQTEAAKVLNSSNANGVLSDSARHELQDMIDGNMSYSAMVTSLNTLKQDMGNRTKAYQAQIGDIENRLKGGGQPGGPANGDASDGAAPTPQTHIFSVSAWQTANPKGDVNAAKAYAQQHGFQVVQ